MSDMVDQVIPAKTFPCAEEGCEFIAPNPQGLGAHRRHVHNIEGKYASKKKTVKTKEVKEKPTSDIDHLSLTVILKHLFPEGIPAKKVELLMEWIELTKRLVK